MNDDILVTWDPVTLDIGGQPANVLGYRVYDTTLPEAPIADVEAPLVDATLVGYVDDPTKTYSFSVAAYNLVGEGPKSVAVVASPPTASIPEQVTGVTVTIVPK